MLFKEAFNAVLAGKDLDEQTMGAVLGEVLEGKVEDVPFAGFLVALRMKGVAHSELTGAARFLLRHAVAIDAGLAPTVDVVGTGGDGGASFNISTTASFVAAGAGARIAKHGNRAVSGKSGAADVLGACGFNLDCPPVRRALGTPTIFNLLGPLINPAHASAAVIGVYDAQLTELFADTLHQLGMRRALVVHGHDGLDELTVTDATRITELNAEGEKHTYDFYPELLFGQRFSAEEIRGGTPQENAEILRSILEGKNRSGARAVVALNAGAVLYVAGIAQSLEEGYAKACESIDSGAALKKLNALVEISHAS